MDPTIVFCPNLACPARGHVGQGNIGIHQAILVGAVAQAVQKLLNQIAEAYDMQIDTIKVIEDHVLLFLSAGIVNLSRILADISR